MQKDERWAYPYGVVGGLLQAQLTMFYWERNRLAQSTSIWLRAPYDAIVFIVAGHMKLEILGPSVFCSTDNGMYERRYKWGEVELRPNSRVEIDHDLCVVGTTGLQWLWRYGYRAPCVWAFGVISVLLGLR